MELPVFDVDINFSGIKSSISATAIEQRAMKRTIKNNQIHFLKAQSLSDLCVRPLPNEQYRIITEKQFNAYALIIDLLKDSIIDELYIAIYRINEPTVDSIIDLIDNGRIKKAVFIISNYFNQTKKPERWALKLREYSSIKPNVSHRYVHNHAKVAAIKAGDDYYVFEGSGNMSDNARIEQYVYENNKEVFDFHKDWMLKLIA
jgi:hypothetical protein